jgi:hypothetical protein
MYRLICQLALAGIGETGMAGVSGVFVMGQKYRIFGQFARRCGIKPAISMLNGEKIKNPCQRIKKALKQD